MFETYPNNQAPARPRPWRGLADYYDGSWYGSDYADGGWGNDWSGSSDWGGGYSTGGSDIVDLPPAFTDPIALAPTWPQGADGGYFRDDGTYVVGTDVTFWTPRPDFGGDINAPEPADYFYYTDNKGDLIPVGGDPLNLDPLRGDSGGGGTQYPPCDGIWAGVMVNGRPRLICQPRPAANGSSNKGRQGKSSNSAGKSSSGSQPKPQQQQQPCPKLADGRTQVRDAQTGLCRPLQASEKPPQAAGSIWLVVGGIVLLAVMGGGHRR